ncbi:MAG: flippase-like domain-containing protein [Bacteroidales bacterium]|nr:flippase-like domain-containing protein [Bacteroidales bacterium]
MKFINILKFFIFLSVGLFLFWLIYKDQDIDVLKQNWQHTNYLWLGLSLVAGLLSHVIRALRWQKMVQPFGYRPRFSNSFFAVMSTYFANLAVPRLGEVTRPTILKKYEGIPFSTSFGTIVLERLIDLFILFLLTIILFLTQTKVFIDFINNNPDVRNYIEAKINSWLLPVFGAIFLLSIALLLIFRKKIKQSVLYQKIGHKIHDFLQGVQSFRKLKQPFLFVFYTLLIWVLYFLLTYLPVFAFESTKDISVWGGLAFFVIGSYGMVAPVQGGIGAWHFMVAGTLIVIGINDQDARAFALIVHAAQTIMLLVVGTITTILLPVFNHKNKG